MIVLSAKRWVRPDLLMLSLIEVAQRRMVMLGADGLKLCSGVRLSRHPMNEVVTARSGSPSPVRLPGSGADN